MEKGKKQLIITDICARLPYGIKVHRFSDNVDIDIDIENFSHFLEYSEDDEFKSYLRPLSSMTDDEKNVYHKLLQMSVTVVMPNMVRKETTYIVDLEDDGDGLNRLYDWFNENHFDYRGLIPMGLALESPENIYKIEDHEEN